MKVRIVTAEKKTYWYAAQIGCVFNVQQSTHNEDSWRVSGMEDGVHHYIVKSDCEILPEENQPEPFDMERALNGEKVVTREGVVVDELYHFKTYHGLCPITAIIDGEKKTFRIDGKYNESGLDTKHDLFMAPRESEYVTKWVNVFDERVTDDTIRCSNVYHSKEKAAANNVYYSNDSGFIGTFPITFKRPS